MRDRLAVDLRQYLEWLAPVLAMVTIIVLWEIICRVFVIPEFILPSPSEVVTAGLNQSASQWADNITNTLTVAVAGYLVAIVVSIPLAVALGLSPLLSRTIFPILVVIHSTPVVAIAPIIVVTMGTGALPRVFITFLISFFPIIISTVTGILETPEELLEMSRSLRAPRIREIVQIRLPSAIPYIFSALKVSVTLAVIGAVVAEFVASETGLGYAILFSTSSFNVPAAFANLAVLVVLSLILFKIVSIVQVIFFSWSLETTKKK
ncbi:ABC transporter permease [Methylovirgula ligni]|uniref:NitT/TauT family transport system permease protein n=2 Tax=Methylovirgula ligni TaxID=569860 RepID=A0A3D9Z6H8_9HYPH|nr:ABC transporter permease [Methylovirgula ligni]REF89139.1 NitT/TauT family transport system permease protein [Methylovirgula ligni]